MERCDRTDLYMDQCAHCRGHDDMRRPQEPEPGPKGRPFQAAYAGRCSSCDERFEAFAYIRADGEGKWEAECCFTVAA